MRLLAHCSSMRRRMEEVMGAIMNGQRSGVPPARLPAPAGQQPLLRQLRHPEHRGGDPLPPGALQGLRGLLHRPHARGGPGAGVGRQPRDPQPGPGRGDGQREARGGHPRGRQLPRPPLRRLDEGPALPGALPPQQRAFPAGLLLGPHLGGPQQLRAGPGRPRGAAGLRRGQLVRLRRGQDRPHPVLPQRPGGRPPAGL